jgi:hypothetical protein
LAKIGELTDDDLRALIDENQERAHRERSLTPVAPTLRLSNSSELLLRLRWLAILSGRIGTTFAVTGGVHTALDTVKAVMAGPTPSSSSRPSCATAPSRSPICAATSPSGSKSTSTTRWSR